MEKLKNIALTIDNLNEKIGRWVDYFAILLVLLIFIDVLGRYIFNTTYIWMIELEIYCFAFIFILGAGYAFKHDKHVRVDVFYSKWSDKGKAWVNLIGGILFLAPWCWVVLNVSWPYAVDAWLINERSPQAGGLPALYILKFSIFVGFFLLTLQAIASILKSLLVVLDTPK